MMTMKTTISYLPGVVMMTVLVSEDAVLLASTAQDKIGKLFAPSMAWLV
jgi:hypothetical protein